jgi:hypothetical protein
MAGVGVKLPLSCCTFLPKASLSESRFLQGFCRFSASYCKVFAGFLQVGVGFLQVAVADRCKIFNNQQYGRQRFSSPDHCLHGYGYRLRFCEDMGLFSLGLSKKLEFVILHPFQDLKCGQKCMLNQVQHDWMERRITF